MAERAQHTRFPDATGRAGPHRGQLVYVESPQPMPQIVEKVIERTAPQAVSMQVPGALPVPVPCAWFCAGRRHARRPGGACWAAMHQASCPDKRAARQASTAWVSA